MLWIISHQSALEYWRSTLARDSLIQAKPKTIMPSARPLSSRTLTNGVSETLARPLHVLVGDSNARKANQNIRCHICTARLPKASFISAGLNLAVSSPELCFAQMAGEITLVKLIALGYELCGSYRLDTYGDPDRGFRDDQPLTNVAKLKSFVAKSQGLKGRAKATRALRFITNGSASPMETVLTMLLTLSYKLGGYGFALPRLNFPKTIATENSKTLALTKYFCDLYWPKAAVDVEYDSEAYHTAPERVSRDAIRRNALSSVGVTVVTVSRRQIYSAVGFKEVAELLSKLLHKRLQYVQPEFSKHHAELRSQLLPKPSMF